MIVIHLTYYIIFIIIVVTIYFIKKFYRFNQLINENNKINSKNNKIINEINNKINNINKKNEVINDNEHSILINDKINTNLAPFIPIKSNFHIIDDNGLCIYTNGGDRHRLSKKCDKTDLSQLWSFNKDTPQIISNNIINTCLNNDLSTSQCVTISKNIEPLNDLGVCIKELNQKWSLDPVSNLITSKNNKTTNTKIIQYK